MADGNQLNQAKTTFSTLCKALDAHGLHYEKKGEELQISCRVQGDDLPMDVNIYVDPDKMLVLLLSMLPMVTPKEKRVEMAAAVCLINYKLNNGSFDYDIRDGHMFFRMTSSFRESLLGEELFSYMLSCSFYTIDEYNDKFLLLAKGLLSLEQFQKATDK